MPPQRLLDGLGGPIPAASVVVCDDGAEVERPPKLVKNILSKMRSSVRRFTNGRRNMMTAEQEIRSANIDFKRYQTSLWLNGYEFDMSAVDRDVFRVKHVKNGKLFML